MATLARNIGIAARARMGEELLGPVGERNLYGLRPRGTILLRPTTRVGLFHHLAAALATGNAFALDTSSSNFDMLINLPASIRMRMSAEPPAAVLVEGDDAKILHTLREIAQQPGGILTVQAARPEDMNDARVYSLDALVEEVSTSINTTAAGGNASLMANS